MVINYISLMVGAFCVIKILTNRNYNIKTIFSLLMIILLELYFVFKILLFTYIAYMNYSIDISSKLTSCFLVYRYILELPVFVFIIVMAIVNITKKVKG